MCAPSASHADTKGVTTPPNSTSTSSDLAAVLRRWRDRSHAVSLVAVERCKRFAAVYLTPLPAPDWSIFGVDASGVPAAAAGLDIEAQQWLHAHRSAIPDDAGDNTALVFADTAVQQWMAATLAELGWSVSEPVMFSEGWVPARGENTATGQPATVYTTPGGAFARKSDPSTSKKAGAAAAANQSVTVTSQQGQLLFAYHARHLSHPGSGYTAAEAVTAAGLRTDGATGSPWHRVSDLHQMGLLTVRLDDTLKRVTRKNESNSEGQVLIITPLGLRAAAALSALREHGYTNYPLNFDGPTEATLFEELPATLARISSLDAPGSTY